jgi:EmrB/QacA subfamily drug resistance transporter
LRQRPLTLQGVLLIVAERPPCDTAVARAAPETPGCASHARRWVLTATILGSSLAFMMASIINVALPAIQQTFGATVAETQWVASAYTVLLASLTLAGGAVGDRFGRRRAFQAGTIGLALASIAGSLATDVRSLIAARAAQGLAAALLVPNSLALLSAAFPRAERGRAIGTWSAATSLVGAVSPILGGWFVDTGSWRVAFAAVMPPALLTFAVAARRVPDSPVMRRSPAVDWVGSVLATLGLFGTVGGIIAFGSGMAPLVGLAAGGVALVAFVLHERHAASPMIPPALFASRTFRGVNILTLLLYAGVAGAFFVLPFNLVQVQGYSSTATGAAFLPFALLMGLLSRRVGGLADRIGTTPLLVGGPLLTAGGLASFALPGIGGPYWATFLAPMILTGLGMALTVAPLTTSVLGAVEPAEAGVASGVNNTVARVGTLLAVAIIGVVAFVLYGRALERRLAAAAVPAEIAQALIKERRSLADTTIPDWVPASERSALTRLVGGAFLDSFRGSMLFCAALALGGAAIAAAMLGTTNSLASEGATPTPTCDHLDTITDPEPRTRGCEECLRAGDSWVHLRLCLSCGHVGCCDSSRNRHATAHFWSSRHPIVRSLEPGEDWRWCYADEIAV